MSNDFRSQKSKQKGKNRQAKKVETMKEFEFETGTKNDSMNRSDDIETYRWQIEKPKSRK
jgi:hypothetical protein